MTASSTGLARSATPIASRTMTTAKPSCRERALRTAQRSPDAASRALLNTFQGERPGSTMSPTLPGRMRNRPLARAVTRLDMSVTRLDPQAAAEELARRDPALGRWIEAVGTPQRREPHGSPFAALTRAIVFQELAGRAATGIHARVLATSD